MVWWEGRLDISVLVVDDDLTSLNIIVNILNSWEYKVLTANSAHNALETLREFEGFFDIVITELYISGMNGFEFQRRIKDEFQIPVIMMSEDRRESVMSKSIENGASRFMLKPICADELRDIWQYTSAANKGSDHPQINENEPMRIVEGGEKFFFKDTNNSLGSPSLVTSEPKGIENKGKRKSCEMDQKEEHHKSDQAGNSSRGKKRSKKMTWSTTLHSRFLMAIKHIGLDKAVPKKILEVMNVPDLTRENVASHLQKYRLFLKNVAQKGIIDQSISNRILRSRFASELPVSMIRDIQSMSQKLSPRVQQYLKGQGGSTFQGLFAKQLQQQFPNPLQRGNGLQNHQGLNDIAELREYNSALSQVRLGDESINFGSRIIGGANNNSDIHHQNMPLGSHNKGSNMNAAGPASYAIGQQHGLLTCANGLVNGGLTFGGTMPQQNYYDPLGKNNIFNYDGLGNKTDLPLSSSSHYPGSVSSEIQLNDGSQMINTVATPPNNNISNYNYNYNNNNNSFGLMNETQNAIGMSVTPPLWNNGNSGLVQGSSSAAAAMNNVYGSDELLEALVGTNATPGGGNANTSAGIMQQLPQQIDGPWNGNAAGINNENQTNASSIREGEATQVENDDLSNFFKMLADIELPDETGESINANEFLNSDVFGSSLHVQPPNQTLQQLQKVRDVIVPSTENNINLPNEFLTGNGKNALQDNDGVIDWESFDSLFVDNNVSSASNSVVTQNQDWDMALFQAVFGTEGN